ncbi:MAG TPA: hypothetical protein VGP08_26230 [Pyrinomonadaceae bacterium]|jgi:hypothetical protein|nr:hypothetical protein [Pyrinomonadaceae bacterium]
MRLAVVRVTVLVCVGAVCKAGAAALIETLFSHHVWTLHVFTLLLDVTLIGFSIDVVLDVLEDLKVPARSWLNWLYEYLMPRSKSKPERVPEERQEERKAEVSPKKVIERKGGIVKSRKNPLRRRRAAKSLPPASRPSDAMPPATKPPAKPLVIPRRNPDQGLDS